ncbi:PP2C family protein-serine/threonine phosphatase [Rhizobium leguminosarum]|uniref:PP2C family protein-serine/threonine phosphatase n=1 Tax=Rhizobium leguminosarum TaxID=384 RepID=UPI0013EEC17F|nr:PP2C family serine/threonine-protein phosphatase [Rhizobium leguminosarum]
MIELLSFSFSFRGPREDNQDKLLGPLKTGTGAWLVGIADGVGGSPGGGEAAELAVDTVRDAFRVVPFDELIATAAAAIARRAEEDAQLRKMATTLSLVRIDGKQATVAHVGDTRIYHLRGHGLNSLTEDQTEVAELRKKRVLSEYQLKNYPRKNVLTSVLSPRMDYNVYYAKADVLPGDRLVLLTDGTYSVVPKKVIADLSVANSDPQAFLEALRTKTEASDPRDNYSAIVLECR